MRQETRQVYNAEEPSGDARRLGVVRQACPAPPTQRPAAAPPPALPPTIRRSVFKVLMVVAVSAGEATFWASGVMHHRAVHR
jgi:hypothetical protein